MLFFLSHRLSFLWFKNTYNIFGQNYLELKHGVLGSYSYSHHCCSLFNGNFYFVHISDKYTHLHARDFYSNKKVMKML